MQSNSKSQIKVHLDDFDGPLELLLHLINQSKMDIYDINISEITDQYLNLIANSDPDLDAIGDYFVMATKLMTIKSKLLLPIEESDDDLDDPRSDLVDQLINYQQIKWASGQLRQLELKRDSFTSLPIVPIEIIEPVIKNKQFKSNDILDSYVRIIDKFKLKSPKIKTLTKWNYNVDHQIIIIKNKLNDLGNIRFESVIVSGNSEEIITSFLAVLELAKLKEVYLKQSGSTAPLMIDKGELFN